MNENPKYPHTPEGGRTVRQVGRAWRGYVARKRFWDFESNEAAAILWREGAGLQEAYASAAPKAETPKAEPITQTQAIDDFLAKIRDADPDTNFSKLWESEWERIQHLATTTRAQYTSRYRNAIRVEFGPRHPAIAVVRPLHHLDESPLTTYQARGGGPGRPPALMEQMSEFTAALMHARKAAGQDDAKYESLVLGIWTPILDDMRKRLKPTTIRTHIARYRSALRDSNLNDDITMKICSVPIEIWQGVKDASRDALVAQHHELCAVEHWMELRNSAIEALPDAADIAWVDLDTASASLSEDLTREQAVAIGVALSLLTGRRPYEVFCTGMFAPAPVEQGHGYDKWHVRFSGQAKTRAALGTQFEETFTIPVLHEAKGIILASNALRQSKYGMIWERMSNEEFKNDLLREPSPKCILPSIRVQMFGPYWPKISDQDSKRMMDLKKLTAANIRSLYVEIADQFFRPQSVTKAAFYQKSLGHVDNDIETATHYMKYYLPDHKGTGPTRGVKTRLIKKLAQEIGVGDNH